MMKKVLNFLFLILLSMNVATMIAQEMDNGGHTQDVNSVAGYIRNAMLFNMNTPQEKVYLHFDNTGYFKGETIWFKAYVVRCDNGKPTDISRVLYVELLNPGGDVIEKRKLCIDNGVAYGDIKLDSIYGTGFYEVRAYTRYMTNWGNGGLFSRVFPVFKEPATEGDYSQKIIDRVVYKKRLPSYRTDSDDGIVDDGEADVANSETKRTERRNKKCSVRFFPEGGDLIKGLACRMALLVTDENGEGMELSGTLVDKDKNVVSVFNTTKDGRGVVELVPDGEPMFVRVEDGDGKTRDFQLPDSKEEGCALKLDMLRDEEVTATLSSSPGMQGRLMGYVIMNNGRIIECDTLKASPVVALKFDRSLIPAGVSQFTLFDASGRVLADRLMFRCPGSSAVDSIYITTPTMKLRPCGKVQLNIQAQPNSSLSLSAMDAASMTNGREGNALTWLLLSSEVKGYIAHPEYYFESDDREHRLNADLLMMVQGWRRYDWRLMCGRARFKTIQPIEDKLYVFGQLKAAKKKHTVDGVELDAYLFNKSGQNLRGHTVTDSLGNYAFSLPDVGGDWALQIKSSKEGKDLNYKVRINRHFSPAKRMLSPSETSMIDIGVPNLFGAPSDTMFTEEYVAVAKRKHILPEVKIRAKRKRIYEGAREAWETEHNGQHWASIYYDVDEATDRYADEGEAVPTLYEWLYQRNPFFRGTKDVAEYATEENVVEDGKFVTKLSDENGSVQEVKDLSAEEKEYDAEVEMNKEQNNKIYVDGMGYKNRPVVWILNNAYKQITNAGVYHPSSFNILRSTAEDMPIFIDEVKSVYITERSDAFTNYLLCPDLRGRAPVTIFVYTHHSFPWKVKGLRRTHFEGYNMPSVFEMDDYGYLPPMEDFRRTVFWEPNVRTDKDGKASVEFYNNSSCKQMFISAEGMTPEGKFMVNE